MGISMARETGEGSGHQSEQDGEIKSWSPGNEKNTANGHKQADDNNDYLHLEGTRHIENTENSSTKRRNDYPFILLFF